MTQITLGLALLSLTLNGQNAAPSRPDACPVLITIDAHNYLYTNRFNGHYRVSEKTLMQDLRNGCEEAGRVSSVTIAANKNVPYGTVHDLIQRIQQILPPSTPVVLKP